MSGWSQAQGMDDHLWHDVEEIWCWLMLRLDNGGWMSWEVQNTWHG
jgi:hypothetical protein